MPKSIHSVSPQNERELKKGKKSCLLPSFLFKKFHLLFCLTDLLTTRFGQGAHEVHPSFLPFLSHIFRHAPIMTEVPKHPPHHIIEDRTTNERETTGEGGKQPKVSFLPKTKDKAILNDATHFWIPLHLGD